MKVGDGRGGANWVRTRTVVRYAAVAIEISRYDRMMRRPEKEQEARAYTRVQNDTTCHNNETKTLTIDFSSTIERLSLQALG